MGVYSLNPTVTPTTMELIGSIFVILPVSFVIAYTINYKLLRAGNRYALAISVFSFMVVALSLSVITIVAVAHLMGFAR